MKPITAIIVLSLVVAALLISGCTSSTSNSNNQTPSTTPSTGTHDVFLDGYLAALKNFTYSNSSISVKAWDAEKINSTSAHVQRAYLVKSTNATWSYDENILIFPTSQDATNYLNAINKTAYRLASTQYPSEGAYLTATGHAPQIYKQYVWNEGNPYNISEYTGHAITQIDNIIATDTFKRVG